MKRDGAREALPDGAVWNLVDFLPEVLGAVLPQARRLRVRLAGPDRGGRHGGLRALGDRRRVHRRAVGARRRTRTVAAYEIESPRATENIGGAHRRTRNPIFYDDMVIVPDAAGRPLPKKITRSGATHTIADCSGGSSPCWRYGLVYKDVVWLGGNAAFPKRIYFSVSANPRAGTRPSSGHDMSYPITGFAALSNAVLVFSLRTHRAYPRLQAAARLRLHDRRPGL